MIDPWKLIDAYYESNHNYLTKHHIESYDDFVLNKIPYTIQTLNPISVIKNDFKVDIIIDEAIKISPPSNKNGDVIYPNESRLQNSSYFSKITSDVIIKYYKNDKIITEKVFENQLICQIPVMLHSKICYLNGLTTKQLSEMGECPFDQGGYFVVDGKEKVIISQERIATNKLFISNPSDPVLYRLEGLIRSTSMENSLFPKAVYFWVCNDFPHSFKPKNTNDDDEGVAGSYFESHEKQSNEFTVKMSIMNVNISKIPIFIIFRALGIESDRAILDHVSFDDPVMDNYLMKSIVDGLSVSFKGRPIYTQESALEYLKTFVKYDKVDYVKFVIMNDLFPNIGHDFRKKALYLGHLVKELVLTTVGRIPQNKRDNYMFKRVDTTGIELGNIFRDFYNQFRNIALNRMEQEYNTSSSNKVMELIHAGNIHTILRSSIISDGMYKSMKGNWGLTGDPSQQGIVQDVSRLSYIGYVSHMRRVNTPIDRSIKLVEPHRLDSPQWGMMCPIESPDGANIGLLKHMAASCEISLESNPYDVMKCLMDLGLVELVGVTPYNTANKCRVLLNNNWVGVHDDPKTCHDTLKAYRRTGILNAFISISWRVMENIIFVFSDGGRCMRPIIIANKRSLINYSHTDWKTHINGYTYDYTYDAKQKKTETGLEYIDCFETNSLYIAMNEIDVTKEHTHIEIHPCLSLSMYTNTIPFANHNQAPRNVFSGQQGKQAVGIYSTSFNHRIDTASYVLHYPQRNLVSTKMAKYSFKNSMPNGENLIVAIATYTGYNQEDSIIVNNSSIQRGMFNVSYFKSIVDSETSNKYTGEKVLFKNPRELKKKGNSFKFKAANWSKIDEEGFPKENAFIDDGDVYLGKVHELTTETAPNDEDVFSDALKQHAYRDLSKVGDKTLTGTIDKVVKYEVDGNVNVKIRLRKFRIPELGDKMASSHGQKGVCGMVLDQEDMPFTKEGIVPDIIVNPHAFPSRMTIAHMIECVLSKLCCHSGEYIDGTVFENHNIDSYFNILEKNGHHKYGDEILYNGFTGEQIKTEIFFGPTYYYRLKHMVKDKINYRDSGPKEAMTRQPTQGRANGGGLRIGEMETNAILGHGISSFVKESLMERSDKYSISLSPDGGDVDNETYTERTNNDVQTRVEVPYSLKLLRQEVNSMGIHMKLLTSNHEYDTKN